MSHHKHDSSNLSIIDAIEALSGIADLDIEHEEGHAISSSLMEVEGQVISSRNVEWVQTGDVHETVDRVKEIFHVILSYLRQCYRKESSYAVNPKSIEGIKTIMVLVGEAAKKLDKYTSWIEGKANHSITQLPEYRRLQEFYQKKIDRKIDQSILSKWIFGLSSGMFKQEEKEDMPKEKEKSTKHEYIDLDSIKSDIDYELLLMRKEDGTRFFNPRLMRNLKLVCDFGGLLHSIPNVDPLTDIASWQDQVCYIAAQNLLHSVEPLVDLFYKEMMPHKEMELVECLHKSIMALMLAANPRHLPKNTPQKTCAAYFADFQFFLREALKCRDYHNFLVYAWKKHDHLPSFLLQMTHALSRALFLHLQGIQYFVPHIDRLLHEANRLKDKDLEGMENGLLLWSRLAYDYAAFIKILKLHPNGPLLKMMSLMEEGGTVSFDSIIQGNLPNYWFDLYVADHRMSHVRIPSPTRQAVIHKAVVIDEFKGFLLDSEAESSKCHLLINLQDRTTWREFSRSHALEHLQQNSIFTKHIQVVTLAINTDFYHQQDAYAALNDAKLFFDLFKKHLNDESSGFFFTPEIKEILFSGFIDRLFDAIHMLFFNGDQTLAKEKRLDFITLFYLFLELKLIEITHPDSFSLTCKDGIDSGCSASALFFTFFELLNSEVMSEADVEYLNLILYGPSILVRERALMTEPFNRFLGALKTFETVRQKMGFTQFTTTLQNIFGPLYDTPILKGHLVFPTIPEEDQWKIAA